MRRAAPATFRRGLFEPLESRCLLAADLACHEQDGDVAAELAAGNFAPDADDNLSASDAGSTAGTAFDLGPLAGTRSLGGSVGGFDTADVLRFSLADESQVAIHLDGLTRDIDLYLFDGAGRLLDASNKAGSASESISATLQAGDYYILVTPWRNAFSSYVLTVGATLPETPSTNPDTPPVNDPPNPDSDPPGTPVTAFPDVAYYGGSNEWNVNAVNAPESWAQGYTGQDVVVAVVDTGVDVNHPDLVNQFWVNAGEIAGNGIDDDGNGYVDDVSGWDFAGGDNNPNDGNGHGTHVAGTIAADNNGFGATGVAPDATIMPVRVLGNNGSGTAAGVAAGIRYAAAMGADIINLSLGGGFSSVILAAIEYAMQLDVLVVAAAGNESAATPGYPARFAASLSNVISVGAYTSSGTIANFSNRVGASGAVQVDAPGASVYSTYAGGRYGRLSGTSMAAPHVAGLAALALAADNSLSASELRALIVQGAEGTIAGSDAVGSVNAALTVALAASGQTSPASSATPQSQATSQGTFAARHFGPAWSDAVVARLAQLDSDSGATSATSQPSHRRVADTPTADNQTTARGVVLLAMDSSATDSLDALSDDAHRDPLDGDALDGVFGDRLTNWLDPQAALARA